MVYRKKALKDTVGKLPQNNLAVDGKMMIGKRTDEGLGREADHAFYKEKI